MDANELRIGSYVTDGIYIGYISVFNNESCVIKHKSGIARSKIHLLEPIPLTEEWLLKFGFESNNRTEKEKGFILLNKEKCKSVYIRTFCEPNVSGFFTMFNFSECHKDEIQFIKKLEYVHQLQNLYFALCGKELQLRH